MFWAKKIVIVLLQVLCFLLINVDAIVTVFISIKILSGWSNLLFVFGMIFKMYVTGDLWTYWRGDERWTRFF